jgi:hypothetical protein
MDARLCLFIYHHHTEVVVYDPVSGQCLFPLLPGLDEAG